MATMNLKINISAYSVIGLVFFCLPEFTYSIISGNKYKGNVGNTENLLVSTVGIFFLLNALYSYHLLNDRKCLITRIKYYTANTTLFLLIFLVQVMILWTSKLSNNSGILEGVLLLLLANNYIGLKRTQRKMYKK
jgi:hypothetical protein